jgi:hypothetical protein
MSRATLKAIQAAAGNAGEAVYVDDVFSTYLYEGTGSEQTITNGIDLAGEGGLVWIKNRNNTGVGGYHLWFDTARSPTNSDPMYFLRSNETDAQQSVYDNGANRDFVGWESNGFTLGDYYSLASEALNGSGTGPYCSWTFRKQPGFFDVVTYTGDSTSGRTVSHNLGTVPGMIIVKRMTGTGSWAVYHRSTGNTKALFLEMTTAEYADSGYWNNTDPTDSVFTLGNSSTVNNSGQDYVAYLFAHDAQDFGTDSDESIIKCGSFTGNATVDLGFEPQWVMIKRTDNIGNWFIQDSMRGIATGGIDATLFANLSDAENTSSDRIDLTSTGFIAKYGTGTETWIYVAIRRPHKPASEFAATDLFAIDELSVSTTPNFVSGFPVDFAINRQPVGTTSNWNVGARLIQGRRLFTNLTNAESAESNNQFDYQDGYSGANLTNYLGYLFKRAPGFFDVVAYTGTGSTLVLDHNLGVEPEFMIVKGRTINAGWWCYHKDVGNTKAVPLNTDGAASTSSFFWNDTSPTATQVTLGAFTHYNVSNQTGILYLFASVPGISKVGSYTGNGGSQTIDCGFSSSARFVFIKRTSDTSNWMLWDSARGITAATNDPFLYLNTTAAQASVSGRDIDPDPSGFALNTNYDWINLSGSEYIFLAIA